MLLDEALTPEEAQKSCDDDGLYYIKSISIETAQELGLKGFLKTFITHWNNKYCLRRVESDKIQCPTGKYRSITDMTRLAKYYFPDSNIIKVRNALLELAENPENAIGSFICSDIERRVFFLGTGSSDRDNRDEFGWKFNKPQKREPRQTKKIEKDEQE